jgi:hypothetical protein
VYGRGFEDDQREEGKLLVRRFEEGELSFYRGEEVCGGAHAVDHGDGDWNGEGARRGRRRVGDIMAMLKDVLAQRKEEGTTRAMAMSVAVLAAKVGSERRRQGMREPERLSRRELVVR